MIAVALQKPTVLFKVTDVVVDPLIAESAIAPCCDWTAMTPGVRDSVSLVSHMLYTVVQKVEPVHQRVTPPENYACGRAVTLLTQWSTRITTPKALLLAFSLERHN